MLETIILVGMMLLLAVLICVTFYCLSFHIGQRELNKKFANGLNGMNVRVEELEKFKSLGLSLENMLKKPPQEPIDPGPMNPFR